MEFTRWSWNVMLSEWILTFCGADIRHHYTSHSNSVIAEAPPQSSSQDSEPYGRLNAEIKDGLKASDLEDAFENMCNVRYICDEFYLFSCFVEEQMEFIIIFVIEMIIKGHKIEINHTIK